MSPPPPPPPPRHRSASFATLALLLAGKAKVDGATAAVLRALNVTSRTQAVLAMSELTRTQDNGPGRRKTDP